MEILRGEGVKVSSRQVTIHSKSMNISDIEQFGAEESERSRLNKFGIGLLTLGLLFLILGALTGVLYLVLAGCCFGAGLAQQDKVKAYSVVIVGGKRKLAFTTYDKEKATHFASAIQTAKTFHIGQTED